MADAFGGQKRIRIEIVSPGAAAAGWDRRSAFVVCRTAALCRAVTGHERRWPVPLNRRSVFVVCRTAASALHRDSHCSLVFSAAPRLRVELGTPERTTSRWSV